MNTMKKVKCNKCFHEWEYKGDSQYYVTCPYCYTKVNIRKEDEDD